MPKDIFPLSIYADRMPVARNPRIPTSILSKVKVKVAQSCPTLCDPMDYTLHGILQARILEWITFLFSRGSSQPRNQTQVFCITGGFFYQLSHKGSPCMMIRAYSQLLRLFCVRNDPALSPGIKKHELSACNCTYL